MSVVSYNWFKVLILLVPYFQLKPEQFTPNFTVVIPTHFHAVPPNMKHVTYRGT
jgi:hypothetical protein